MIDKNIVEQKDIIQLHDGSIYDISTIEDTMIDIIHGYSIEDKDLFKLKQGTWYAILTDTGKTLFRRHGLKTNAEYDKALLCQLIDVYLYLSHKYNRLVSIAGYEYFANLPRGAVNRMCQAEKALGLSELSDFVDKITKGTSESIINKLYDSHQVTGQMMLANNLLGWNTSRSTAEYTQRRESISTLEAEFLDIIDENDKNIVQIDDKNADQ